MCNIRFSVWRDQEEGDVITVWHLQEKKMDTFFFCWSHFQLMQEELQMVLL